MPYYHLSTKYHGKKVLWEPRLTAYCPEENIMPRICFAPTLEQCLMALEGHSSWEKAWLLIIHDIASLNKLYVYAINKNSKVKKAPCSAVWDSFRTDEVWRLEPTVLNYQGKLGIKNDKPIIIKPKGKLK